MRKLTKEERLFRDNCAIAALQAMISVGPPSSAAEVRIEGEVRLTSEEVTKVQLNEVGNAFIYANFMVDERRKQK